MRRQADEEGLLRGLYRQRREGRRDLSPCSQGRDSRPPAIRFHPIGFGEEGPGCDLEPLEVASVLRDLAERLLEGLREPEESLLRRGAGIGDTTCAIRARPQARTSINALLVATTSLMVKMIG
jgi:hypothetical protein